MLQELRQTPASPAQHDLTAEESAAAARAVVNLFARWGLGDGDACDLLGGMAPRTWSRWKAGDIGRIDRDLATRLSLFLGIHAALRVIFGSDLPRAYGWISIPNADLGGQSALDLLRRGQIIDLYRLRQYLDAERGGW